MKKVELANEILSLRSELKIPIDSIRIDGGTVQIFSGKADIGSIPFMNSLGNLYYNYSEIILNNLDWNKIHSVNKELIDIEITKVINQTEFTTKLGIFRRLYVYDMRNNYINNVLCIYKDNSWAIEIIDNV
jgi:hypothetical protein